MSIAINGTPLLDCLPRVPVQERRQFARAVLTQVYPDLVGAFDAIPAERVPRCVLFFGIMLYSRERRFADAARLAGWHPILVSCFQPSFDPAKHFTYYKIVADQALMVLAGWLFPGPLAHLFVWNGGWAPLFVTYKQQRLILDVYDTLAGFKPQPANRKEQERLCIAAVDGITHRDLRIKFLQRLHGYRLPRHNVLIHDPLLVSAMPAAEPVRRAPDGEIHVVSVGSTDARGRGNCLLRTAEAICAQGIHVHVYFNPRQEQGQNTADHFALERVCPFFHVEKVVFGDEYWQRLQSYDFGMVITDSMVFGEENPENTRDAHEACGSSRLADYITADLPVIVARGLRFQVFWARRYARIVVPADADFARNPRPILEAALARKASLPPKDLSRITVEGVAPRLGRFYEKVAAG